MKKTQEKEKTMIYLKLFWCFLKIGMFSFGGGYAMIPLIQKDIESNGWLTMAEFTDIIAISEMTPGPIAVNSATFVGYKTAGLFGGLIATIGVALPSLVMILAVSGFFYKIRKNPVKIMAFYGIRPVITGLILSAGFLVMKSALFDGIQNAASLGELIQNPAGFIDFIGAVIMAAALAALIKFKMNPILVIACAGTAGVLFYQVVPALV